MRKATSHLRAGGTRERTKFMHENMLTRFVRLRARHRDLGIIDETAVIGPIQDNTTYAIPVAAYIKAYAQ